MKRQSAILGMFLTGLAYSGDWTVLRSAEVVKDTADDLPGVYYLAGDPDRKYPIWVEEKNMVTPSGELRTDIIAPSELIFMRDYLSSPPQKGCISVGPFFEDIAGLPPRRTVEEGTANSRLVILGTVTAKASGFSGAIPGQLLRVVPTEVLKGQPRKVDAYYVFFPIGRVKLGKADLCKEDPRYPEAPRIGDSMIIFTPDLPPWKEDEPFLEPLDEGGFITVHPDGSISLPDRFHSPEAKSKTGQEVELLERIRAAAGRQKRESPTPDCECPPTYENGCDGNGRCIQGGGDGDCELDPLNCGPLLQRRRQS